jgi:hypothetical protein
MRRFRVLFISTLACLVVAGPVAAAKPLMERVPINDVGIHDEFLSEECGYDIWFDAVGHITFRVWLDADENPVREVNNYGVRLRYYSEWGSVSTVDVGADRVTHHPDGSLTLVIIGNVTSLQIPGMGRVYADVGRVAFHFSFPDPEGEPMVEVLSVSGQHSDFPSSDILCEALAP